MQRYDYLKVKAYKKDNYDEIRDFQEGLAKVLRHNKWGFINQEGYEVIPCLYEWVSDFQEDLALIFQNDKFGVIDKEGKIVIPCNYDKVSEFHEDFSFVLKNYKWKTYCFRDVLPSKQCFAVFFHIYLPNHFRSLLQYLL